MNDDEEMTETGNENDKSASESQHGDRWTSDG